MSSKRAVVTFANRKGRYIEGMARLAESLRNNFDGAFIAFTHEETLGCPPHEENPYAFKVKALQRAYMAGYTSLLWLDCSCFAVAPLEGIFKSIEHDGFIAQASDHRLGTWTNDKCLAYYGISRDQAMDICMIGDAGFLGFNMDHVLGNTFFSRWQEACEQGMFKGGWINDGYESRDDRCKGHRHDMSCSSALAYQLSLPVVPHPVLQYAGPYDEVCSEHIVIKAQGL